MDEGNTTLLIQGYLDDLADGSTSDSTIRVLLERSVRRLEQLCAAVLHRSYPRLTRAPLNLQTDEMLSAVVERLLKALREARPRSVREFFALASQHIRWELNDMARRLDHQAPAVYLDEALVSAPFSSDTAISPNARRILDAIEKLPQDEREAFDLVRIQGMSQAEAGHVLGVSAMTVNRRLSRSLQLLTAALKDLDPDKER